MEESATHNVADVCIGAQCPSYQETNQMIVALFLQRGCSRALPRPPEELRQHRLLVGFTPEGLPCVAHIDPRLRQWTTDDASIRSFSLHLFISLWGGKEISCHFAPLSPLLTAKRLRDLKVALWASRKGIAATNINGAVEQKSEQGALRRLEQKGIDLSEKGDHPLDSIAAFREHSFHQPRSSRVVSCDTHADFSKDDIPDSLQQYFFTFPAFAREFQNANPTTFISRVQLIHAALVYFWIRTSKDLRGDTDSKGHFVPDVATGVFLAYFPTWLKFHELFRLGAYIHPFDFISSVYSNDLKMSDQYLVHGESLEAKFGALKDFGDPFALLTPAMQEGSALGGPFLPLECTLSEVHHRMGLGSIWTIGLPLMPVSIEENGKMRHYRLYAFPKHWQTELSDKHGYIVHHQAALATMASVTASISEGTITHKWSSIASHINRCNNRVAYHIGTKLGTPTGKVHPGWTTHLPGKDGLLCKRYGCHDLTKTQFGPTVTGPVSQDAISMNDNGSHPQNLSPTRSPTSTWPQVRFGSPINLAEVDSADAIRWSPLDVKPNSFEARILPGVPVEVHGPPVSTQPSKVLPATLKRRATGDLHYSGSPKKMKSAAETHLNLEGLDANDAGRLMGYAHKEILSVATTAGLLNPTYLEVGPSGTLGLMESGLMAIEDSKPARTDPDAPQNRGRRKGDSLAAEVRHLMDQGGFWKDGHTSLLPLKNLLNGGQEISSAEVVHCITRMHEQVADSLEDLLETEETLTSHRHKPMTEEMKTAVMRALNALYSQHGAGSPSLAARSSVANALPGRPRLKMAQYLVGIAGKYLDLIVFSDGLLKPVKPVMNELQFTRSLTREFRLSNAIRQLLDVYHD
ncbi:hypothetical protein NCS52_00736400 [Fusarium sp. LHS14.1]|nr:hypothetical protein NCS52_00736400 [Fusarium sp. LHS14.1]